MSQLAKLVALLSRDDIDEVVIATGRPIAVRQNGAYQPVSKADVSRAQLASLVAGTPIAAMLDAGNGGAPSVAIADQQVAVEVQPHGAEVVVRLQRAQRAKRPTRAKTPTQSKPRAKRATRAGGFTDLVREARARGASDLHIAAEREPQARVLGMMTSLGPLLDEAGAESLLLPLLDEGQRKTLAERGYVDSALDVEGGGRLRANISRARLGMKGSFRLIAERPSSLEELGLPKELARVTSYHQGLVVIAGPSGHGKTTTLAALVELINAHKPHHILTIEDPVEIVFQRRKSLVSQREVGNHTRSFATALKASLREDPDVIVIGELRDRETVEIALTAAETGHLVMATMSTPSAAKTLDRLVDMFPPDDQQQVRVSLAAALKFVVAQRLLPAADGQSTAVAVELLTGVLPLAALIRDNKLYQVASLQQRGRAFGMIRLDDSIAELVRAGRVTEEVAMRSAENKKELAATLNPQAGAAPTPASHKSTQGFQKISSMFRKVDGQ
ncbi:MAG TPA: PilT/PilU family type 4a pilus ATPase [Kofleriaceae bacterium]|nr:PilT/PilU family type 4a pilus ATPase [Kofleriaceae bacterium]